MKLLVVNPNTTASMTAKIGAAARSVAAPGTEIEAVNPAMGPVSIEGFYDEALCLPGLLTEIAAGARRGAEAAIVACFDDPGIDAARAIAPFPVLGICEAAMRMAGFLGHRFTIVTTLPISLPAMDGLIRRYGMAERGRARAAGVPVLALEDRASGAVEKVRAEIRRAIAEDGAECILLGCAGMADLARDLTAEMGLPVIDGVAAAVKLSGSRAKVIGVEPALASDAQQSLRAGHVVRIAAESAASTVADGLRTQSIGALNFEHLTKYLDGVVTVAEDEILRAMRQIITGARLMTEPSGAVTMAAWMFHAAELPSSRKAVAIISGGNADPKQVAEVLEGR